MLAGIGLELSGSGRFLTGLAAGLDAAGHETHLFVVRGGPLAEDLEGTGVQLVVAAPELGIDAGRLALGVGPFFALRRTIAEVRPDVLHTNLIGVDAIGRAAAWTRGVPVVMSTQHDLNPRPWFVDAFRRATVGRIAATVACSAPVADYCRSVMRVPEDRLFTIDNGVDVARLASAAHPMRTPPAFLAMGALVPVKAHEVLLEAFSIVRSQRLGATLTIAGDGPLREHLLERSRDLGLGDAARIVPPTPDIVSLLSEADVFVQPSLREGLPMALLEAMAAGKAVVASDIAAHMALLGGGCGLTAAAGDARALADTLLAATADPTASDVMGANASARVAAEYSSDLMVARYGALYERLTAAVITPRA